ncbi:MAG: hypothetical protein RL071_4838 [Pseudomonadota bacterium]
MSEARHGTLPTRVARAARALLSRAGAGALTRGGRSASWATGVLLTSALSGMVVPGGHAWAGVDREAVGVQAAVGPVLRSDRGRPMGLKGGFAVELEAPVVWRFGARFDLVTGMDSADQLRATGPTLALMPVFRQPLDVYFIEAAAGPTLWTGRSAWWGGAYPGPFPGVRGALGFGLRPHPLVSGKLELGTDHSWGTHPFVNGQSHGWDLRLMISGHLPPLQR